MHYLRRKAKPKFQSPKLHIRTKSFNIIYKNPSRFEPLYQAPTESFSIMTEIMEFCLIGILYLPQVTMLLRGPVYLAPFKSNLVTW